MEPKRVLTTLTDNKGARLTGTDISSEVWDVVKTGKTYRDTNYKVDGKRYCAVYVPLKDNNQVVGCVFAGQPTSDITNYIMQKVGTMLIVSAVVLILVGIVATFIAQSISKSIKRASVSVTKVAGGDLTVEVDKTVLKRQDEIGDMGRALETLIIKLREIVGSLAKSATDLGESGNSIDSMASQSSVAAGEISTAVEEISKGAVSQAEDIETATNEIMTMGEQITQIVNNIADLTKTSKNMEEAENASQDTMIELSDAVQRTTDAVARIAKQIETTNESVDKIGNAASLIADIASQTSLLSLNASIESARAGEAGKGFAVVASEIQKLSSQSDSTASKIQEIITDLQNDSKETLEVMRSTEVLVREQYEKLAATKERFKEVGNGINVSKRGTDVIKGNAEVCDSSRVTVVDVISNLSAISEENAAFDALIEETMDQETYDEVSGLELRDVMEQAVEQGVDFNGMEPGEITTIKAMARTAGVGSQQVTIEKGPIYRYADYGLGTYLTEPYYISYGSVRATAYCIQPAKPGPGSGIYTITKLADNQALAKVCYYGTDAAGAESYFANKHRDFSSGKRFILVHMAAAYAYGSSDAFYGTNATGQELAMDIYNYCVKKSEIPDVSMSFSDANVKAYVEGNTQRTKEITFHAAGQQSVTISLPSGVRFHNVSTGSTSAPGAKVTIQGGTKFYLSAPLTQASDTAEVFATTMAGGLKKDYSAYKLTTNGSVQDLAFIFGEGVETTNKVSLNVTWTKQAEIAIVKMIKPPEIIWQEQSMVFTVIRSAQI